jgi:hypothetical protein
MHRQETSAESQRMKFIAALLESHPSESFTENCRRAGVSRPASYKWTTRYDLPGPAAMLDGQANGISIHMPQV